MIDLTLAIAWVLLVSLVVSVGIQLYTNQREERLELRASHTTAMAFIVMALIGFNGVSHANSTTETKISVAAAVAAFFFVMAILSRIPVIRVLSTVLEGFAMFMLIFVCAVVLFYTRTDASAMVYAYASIGLLVFVVLFAVCIIMCAKPIGDITMYIASSIGPGIGTTVCAYIVAVPSKPEEEAFLFSNKDLQYSIYTGIAVSGIIYCTMVERRRQEEQ